MALYIKHPITCILSNVQLDEDIRNTKCYRFRYKKMQMSCDQNSAPLVTINLQQRPLWMVSNRTPALRVGWPFLILSKRLIFGSSLGFHGRFWDKQKAEYSSRKKTKVYLSSDALWVILTQPQSFWSGPLVVSRNPPVTHRSLASSNMSTYCCLSWKIKS